jgi:hypothetical protein
MLCMYMIHLLYIAMPNAHVICDMYMGYTK